ncbi:hypothetical protein AMS68_000304 [Peltaster fructicola]|uniref:Homeobox domain-containing protein n=1 Tax=Peltaster fructicola TaxID=286661 RepID=A0A6H0XJ88_9PEZI|nr:hypothetical protein AMS68_000304 [Peltaster fructicola]
MEGKRALEDAGPAHDSGLSNGTLSRNDSPRLPTPDASRASDASSYTSAETRRGPAVSDLLSFRPHVTTQSDVKDYNRPSSQDGSALRSPLYGERRPLLPPLKMVRLYADSAPSMLTFQVIANAMNSPPETPRVDGASFQPSPREPAISASTFKPLAFYPNKRTRTEDRPQWQSVTARTSPEHTSASYPGYARRLSDPSTKRHRRYSLHSTYSSSRCYEPGKKSYYTFTGRPNSSGMSTSSHFESTLERPSFDRFPISPSSDTSCGRTDTIPYRTAGMHTDTRSYAHLPPPSPEYDQASTGAFKRHVPDTLRRGSSYNQSGTGYHRHFDDHDCHDSCHTNAGAFFMPPHYDYSQGKSRKRSNLPKQSTEIMKTWFDNNISNPYPSEEQKALFSSATGISMTQVSNWFINHRRRCPELREKRERVRTGGILDA